MCSTLELPTPTTRPLLHGDISCDCGWPPLRAREGGSGRSRTVHTRSGAGYRSTTRKRPARWMRSETYHEARHGYRTTITFHAAYGSTYACTVQDTFYEWLTCHLSKGDRYQIAATAVATPAPTAACCTFFLRISRRTSFSVVAFMPGAGLSIASQSSHRVVLVALHKPTVRKTLISIEPP